jgi:hypothetical protein
MQCNFSYQHYYEILNSFKKKGYKFGLFDEENQGKTVYLRHDIDHSIEKAVIIADIERTLGARATYCLRLASPFDNIFYKKNQDAIRKILFRGHDIALHFEREAWEISDHLEMDIIKQINLLKLYFPIKNIVSFHRPQGDILNKHFDEFINTYDKPFFKNATYLSDSTGDWRSGCPCTHKEDGNYQILTHPIWWGREVGEPCDHLHNFMKNKMYEWDQIYYDDNPFYTRRLK